MKIHITNFVRRQTEASPFSYWTISDDELIARIHQGLFAKGYEQGYREGVILVNVAPEGFYSSIIQLVAGDILVGEYSARKENEEPRKGSYALNGKKIPAKSVQIVLYHHDVLAEKNENETDDADYEIVSVNASPTLEGTPIPSGALIANHLGISGGTDTKMTDSEFVELLRKSVEFWKDKANLAPANVIANVKHDLNW